MRQKRKWLAGLLAALVLAAGLSGCTNEDGDAAEKTSGARHAKDGIEYGRYVEEDITPPGIKGSVRAVNIAGDDIDVVAVAYSHGGETGLSSAEYYRFYSEDAGATWQDIGMDWAIVYSQSYDEMNPPQEFAGLGHYMALLENGDLLLQAITYTSEYEVLDSQLLRASREGDVRTVQLRQWQELKEEGVQVQVEEMQALPGGKLYISFEVLQQGESIMRAVSPQQYFRAVYDAETLMHMYDVQWDGWNLLHNGECLFLVEYDGTIKAVDIATGQPVTDAPLPGSEELYALNSSYGAHTANIYIDEEFTVCSLDSRGLHSLTLGEDAQTLMAAENYSFGSPLATASFFTKTAQDEFYVVLEEEWETTALLRYYYDEGVPATSGTVLRIYSMYDSSVVRLAINEFKKAYPEHEVEYTFAFAHNGWGEVSAGSGEVAAEEDALRILSTQLLAGDGPDVLILDDLPLESYMEQGILEDISEVVAQTDASPALVKTLLAEDGALYAMPAGFFVPLLFGEAGTVESAATLDALLGLIGQDAAALLAEPDAETATAEDWQAYAEQWNTARPVEERPVLEFSSVEQVVDMLYRLEAPGVYSAQTGFDEKALATLLEGTKLVADVYGLQSVGHDTLTFSNGVVVNGNIAYSVPVLLEGYQQQKAQYGLGIVGGFYALQDVRSNAYWGRFTWVDDGTGAQQVENEGYITPHPEAAALTGTYGGVYRPSVLAGVCATSKQKTQAHAFITCMLGEGVQSKDLAEGFPVSEGAFQTQYESFVELSEWEQETGIENIVMDPAAIWASLQTPVYNNTVLQTCIARHAARYCAGEANLQEAVDAILEDSALYFAEKQ